MDMFAELGDKIALQYGGSEAHNKVYLCMLIPIRRLVIVGEMLYFCLGAGWEKWTSC
jgi:hypothetical protein